MTPHKPTSTQLLQSLLRADFAVQTRRGRSVLMSFLVPIILLVAWQKVADKFGSAFVLASCISIGLISVGLVGYSSSLAQDREKGVFQRLRVTPAPTWTIMGSRLIVQLATIILMTILVIIAAYFIDKINIGIGLSLLSLLAALCGGALFLALGQAVAGLVKSADAVNSAGRLLYTGLVFSGIIGSFGVLGNTIKEVIDWSPYGTVQTVLQAALHGGPWTTSIGGAFLATIGYVILFAGIGIRYFQWSAE